MISAIPGPLLHALVLLSYASICMQSCCRHAFDIVSTVLTSCVPVLGRRWLFRTSDCSCCWLAAAAVICLPADVLCTCHPHFVRHSSRCFADNFGAVPALRTGAPVRCRAAPTPSRDAERCCTSFGCQLACVSAPHLTRAFVRGAACNIIIQRCVHADELWMSVQARRAWTIFAGGTMYYFLRQLCGRRKNGAGRSCGVRQRIADHFRVRQMILLKPLLCLLLLFCKPARSECIQIRGS